MNRLDHRCVWGLALIAFALTPVAAAADSPVLPGPFETFGGTRWTVADFDGDGLPDILTARPDAGGPRFHHSIEIQLSSGTRRLVSFTVDGLQPGPAGIQVFARDVDGDHDVDLVFTTAVSHQAIGVWINNGAGSFARSSDPAHREAPRTLAALPALCSPADAGLLEFIPRQPSPHSGPGPLRRDAPALNTCSYLRGSLLRSPGRVHTGARQTRAPPALL